MLVDPLAQKYIYANGLYRREPQYKTPVTPVSTDVEIVENPIGHSSKNYSTV